jgi:ubiquinone/menaquinone biosynthesis C-methylase UbiE
MEQAHPEMDERAVTLAGNPAKPQGELGAQMLQRMNRSHGPVTNWALDLLDLFGCDSALDVGCGGGATLARLSSRMRQGSGVSVTGVDYSEVSCEQSRERNAAEVESGRVRVVRASVDDLPFGDGSFDVVTTVESFYFWPDSERGLREVLRVLRPSGRFMLVADVYRRPGLPAETLENIARYEMTVLTPEGYEELLARVGFSSATSHVERDEGWIAVEGVK